MAPQIQSSQDMATGSLENKRSKREQYDSRVGQRGIWAQEGGQTVAHLDKGVCLHFSQFPPFTTLAPGSLPSSWRTSRLQESICRWPAEGGVGAGAAGVHGLLPECVSLVVGGCAVDSFLTVLLPLSVQN